MPRLLRPPGQSRISRRARDDRHPTARRRWCNELPSWPPFQPRESINPRANFVARHDPTVAFKICHDLPFELLMEMDGPSIVTETVGEQGQRELRRPAAAVTPLETRGTVVPQVEAGIERMTIDCDDNGVAFPFAFIEFHASLLSVDGLTEPPFIGPFRFLLCFPEGESGCFRRFCPGTLRLRISISELAEIRNLRGDG